MGEIAPGGGFRPQRISQIKIAHLQSYQAVGLGSKQLTKWFYPAVFKMASFRNSRPISETNALTEADLHLGLTHGFPNSLLKHMSAISSNRSLNEKSYIRL
jgi:hypothetical protein